MSRLFYGPLFAIWLLIQIPKNALRIAWDVLTPNLKISPSIVEFRVGSMTPVEVALLESAITITPGTLTLGVAALPGEPKTLYVHFLYAHSREAALAELRDMKRRLLLATRGREVTE